MPFVFTPDRWRAIAQRRDQVHAILLPMAESVREQTLRRVWRETVVHDEDGNPTGRQRRVVNDVAADGTLRPAVLTVLAVELITIDKPISVGLAKACGYKMPGSLRAAWTAAHPRSPLARAAYFIVGDHRDRDRYLNWTGRAGGDYTGNPMRSSDPGAPCLTREQYENLGATAQQRTAKMRLDQAARMKAGTLADRARRVEVVTAALGLDVRRSWRVMDAHAERAERRNAAAKL